MRVLVCGGRNFNEQSIVDQILGAIHAKYVITRIFEGGASGADSCARNWAKSVAIPLSTFPAEWDNLDALGAVVKRSRDGRLYNAKAGFDRNERMIREKPDLVIAFPGGKGTAHMASLAERDGIKLIRLQLSPDSSEVVFETLRRQKDFENNFKYPTEENDD